MSRYGAYQRKARFLEFRDRDDERRPPAFRLVPRRCDLVDLNEVAFGGRFHHTSLPIGLPSGSGRGFDFRMARAKSAFVKDGNAGAAGSMMSWRPFNR